MNISYSIGIMIILLLVLFVRSVSYNLSIREVRNRYEYGDIMCSVKKTWYGYRVIEYAEINQ